MKFWTYSPVPGRRRGINGIQWGVLLLPPSGDRVNFDDKTSDREGRERETGGVKGCV